MPSEARTLAIGVCNSGSSLGAMIAPPLVVGVTGHRRLARRLHCHRRPSASYGCWHFNSFGGPIPRWPAPKAQPIAAADRVHWVELLRYRQTWAVFFCRFFADPLWFFYVFWIPEFLTRERGLNLAGIAAVAWIPFLVCRHLQLLWRLPDAAPPARRLEREPHAQDADGDGRRCCRRSASSRYSRTRCSGPSP